MFLIFVADSNISDCFLKLTVSLLYLFLLYHKFLQMSLFLSDLFKSRHGCRRDPRECRPYRHDRAGEAGKMRRNCKLLIPLFRGRGFLSSVLRAARTAVPSFFVRRALFSARFHLLRTLSEYPRKGCKDNCGCNDSRREIGDPLGHIDPAKAQCLRQHKAQRYQNNNLPRDGKKQCGFSAKR